MLNVLDVRVLPCSTRNKAQQLHHDHTDQDNILSNFPSSDGLLVLGRTGVGATLFFSLPILILPMREARRCGWLTWHLFSNRSVTRHRTRSACALNASRCFNVIRTQHTPQAAIELLVKLQRWAHRRFSSSPSSTSSSSPVDDVDYRTIVGIAGGVGEGGNKQPSSAEEEEGEGERQPLLLAGYVSSFFFLCHHRCVCAPLPIKLDNTYHMRA